MKKFPPHHNSSKTPGAKAKTSPFALQWRNSHSLLHGTIAFQGFSSPPKLGFKPYTNFFFFFFFKERERMRKLRWAMDGGFWDLDMATPRTIDGSARLVPGNPLPLGLSRGTKLSRPKQLDFMHRFMSMPFVPCYSGDSLRGGDGFSLQRVVAFPFGENW